MEQSHELQVVDSNVIHLEKKPAEVMQEAAEASAALMSYVDQTNSFLQIGGKKHLYLEAWQLLGRYYGLSVKIVKTEAVNFGSVTGFLAAAELIHSTTGRVVSSAEAMCLNDESRWSMRTKYEHGQKVGEEPVPLFQLRSMAQTRACSKAYRNTLSWIVLMSKGYSPTPAEEMTGNEHETETPKGGIERRIPSKYDNAKCGFCGQRHISKGDEIVLVDGKWGAEGCLAKPATETGAEAEPEPETTSGADHKKSRAHIKQVQHLDTLFKKGGKGDKEFWQSFMDTFGDGTPAGLHAATLANGDPMITVERYNAWRDALENGIKGGATEEFFNRQLKDLGLTK